MASKGDNKGQQMAKPAAVSALREIARAARLSDGEKHDVHLGAKETQPQRLLWQALSAEKLYSHGSF